MPTVIEEPKGVKGHLMFKVTNRLRSGQTETHLSSFRDADHARAFHQGRHEVEAVEAVEEVKTKAAIKAAEAEVKKE